MLYKILNEIYYDLEETKFLIVRTLIGYNWHKLHMHVYLFDYWVYIAIYILSAVHILNEFFFYQHTMCYSFLLNSFKTIFYKKRFIAM